MSSIKLFGIVAGALTVFGFMLAIYWRVIDARKQVLDRKSLEKTSRETTATQICVGLPHRNLNFTGRDPQLRMLREALARNHATALTQAITGIGGVGKTQLALEYAYRFADEYRLIGWIRAEKPETLVSDLIEVVEALELVQEEGLSLADVLRQLHRILAKRDDWLLVFDNAQDVESITDYLPPQGAGHVLITSRNTDWLSVAVRLEVAPFEREESIDFLLKRTKRKDREGADRVADALGDLPLALELAGAWVEQTGITLTDYARLFRKRHKELLAEQEPPDNYYATVGTTWAVALEKLEKEAPAAVDLLELLSCFAPEDVPMFLLAEGAKALPERLSGALGDEISCAKTVAQLRRYGLISVSAESLSLHHLVQIVTLDRLTEEKQGITVESAVQMLAQVYDFRKDEPSGWKRCERLLPHVSAAVGYAEDHGVGLDAASYLLYNASTCLGTLANPSLAKCYSERAVSISEKLYGSNHPMVGFRLTSLGQALYALGDMRGAKATYERALAIIEKAYGPDDPNVVPIVNDLAGVLLELGDTAGAKAVFKRALAIDEKVYGPDHPKTARTASNLGVALETLGDLRGAKAAYERALSIFEKVYGPDDPRLAQSLCGLGAMLQRFNDLVGAKAAFERALAIDEKVYSPDHPIMARRIGYLGGILREMGDLHGAKATHERALSIFEKVYGPAHPEVAKNMNYLGWVLKEQGDLRGAKVAHERALSIFEKLYGPDHPEVATSVWSLGAVVQALGDLGGAKAAFEQALAIDERVYGPDHLEVARVAAYLGVVLQQLGDLRGAKAAHERALSIFEKVYGSDHLDTRTERKKVETLSERIACSNISSSWHSDWT
jgi:tetratricopeptide (TPR) repeat protein